MARIQKCSCGDNAVIAYETITEIVWFCGLCEIIAEPWNTATVAFEIVDEGAFI